MNDAPASATSLGTSAVAEATAIPAVATPAATSPVTALAAESLYSWLWQDGDSHDSNWLPFRQSDQKKLEQGEAASVATVDVEGGRWQVDLKERILIDRYGSDPPRKQSKVRRALWFLQAATLIPYDERIGAAIEAAHESVWLAAKAAIPKEDLEIAETVNLESGRKISLKLRYEQKSKTWKLSAKEKSQAATSFMEYAQASLFGKSYDLQRGFGPIAIQPGEEEERVLGSDVGNLIILVHGVGEKMWSEEGCIVECTTHFSVDRGMCFGWLQLRVASSIQEPSAV